MKQREENTDNPTPNYKGYISNNGKAGVVS